MTDRIQSYTREFIAPYSMGACINQLKELHEKPGLDPSGDLRTHVTIRRLDQRVTEFAVSRVPQSGMIDHDPEWDVEPEHTAIVAVSGTLQRMPDDMNTYVQLDPIQITNLGAVMGRVFIAWIALLLVFALLGQLHILVLILGLAIGIPAVTVYLVGKVVYRWWLVRQLVKDALYGRDGTAIKPAPND